MAKKTYLETFEKCPRSLHFSLLEHRFNYKHNNTLSKYPGEMHPGGFLGL